MGQTKVTLHFVKGIRAEDGRFRYGDRYANLVCRCVSGKSVRALRANRSRVNSDHLKGS